MLPQTIGLSRKPCRQWKGTHYWKIHPRPLSVPSVVNICKTLSEPPFGIIHRQQSVHCQACALEKCNNYQLDGCLSNFFSAGINYLRVDAHRDVNTKFKYMGMVHITWRSEWQEQVHQNCQLLTEYPRKTGEVEEMLAFQSWLVGSWKHWLLLQIKR